MTQKQKVHVQREVRLASDIGGTFTDVVLQVGDACFSRKLLTTPDAPEMAVIAGSEAVVADAGLRPSDVNLMVHGTTLATNALIERRGARTGLLTTDGFRDTLEMAHENRFEQYDLNIDRAPVLIPRFLRWTVRERISADGRVLVPIDRRDLEQLIPVIERYELESLAIGFLHAYAHPRHEWVAREMICKRLPRLRISISSEVCPEIREYERISTTCANAYIQPTMAGYLSRLRDGLRRAGFSEVLLLVTSSGTLTDLETAIRIPIRLVESGPAGGAIFASRIARDLDVSQAIGFDMGGTTAKLCLIQAAEPLRTRSFEVGRSYRNLKGSGFPVRIPAIELVEIGAGGGSIAGVDGLARICVGPESAGSCPGPACYGRGGRAATVTDADLVLGNLSAGGLAGGSVPLDAEAARRALDDSIGKPLGLDIDQSAHAVSETVGEAMASAARVHAIECGMELAERTLIAFGGAAPLHAVRLAIKLGVSRVVVPANAAVGSAVGFLQAALAFEVIRSRYTPLRDLDLPAVCEMLAEMVAEGRGVVGVHAGTSSLLTRYVAYMRYRGQGHEIPVELPVVELQNAAQRTLMSRFEHEYRRLFGRTIPGIEVEVLSWAVTVTVEAGASQVLGPAVTAMDPTECRARQGLWWDPDAGQRVSIAITPRHSLRVGQLHYGPLLIVEPQTTTVVPPGFSVGVDGRGHLHVTHSVKRPEGRTVTAHA